MMLSKVLSCVSYLFSSSSFALYVVCLAVGAFGGWYVTSDHYQAEIESIKTQYAVQAAKQESENASRLSKAISERDDALSRLRDVADSNTDLLVHIRMLDAKNRSAKQASSSATKPDESKLSRCRSLLLRGAELAKRGCDEYGRCAADKDALAKIIH